MTITAKKEEEKPGNRKKEEKRVKKGVFLQLNYGALNSISSNFVLAKEKGEDCRGPALVRSFGHCASDIYHIWHNMVGINILQQGEFFPEQKLRNESNVQEFFDP